MTRVFNEHDMVLVTKASTRELFYDSNFAQAGGIPFFLQFSTPQTKSFTSDTRELTAKVTPTFFWFSYEPRPVRN